MKTIIAGSRDIVQMKYVEAAILNASLTGFDISEIVSGTARGVDRLGENYGKRNNIPIKRFPADWNKYGKKAGYIRNEVMALYADALISVWDGKSSGSKDMIERAEKHGLKLFVYKI